MSSSLDLLTQKQFSRGKAKIIPEKVQFCQARNPSDSGVSPCAWQTCPSSVTNEAFFQSWCSQKLSYFYWFGVVKLGQLTQSYAGSHVQQKGNELDWCMCCYTGTQLVLRIFSKKASSSFSTTMVILVHSVQSRLDGVWATSKTPIKQSVLGKRRQQRCPLVLREKKGFQGNVTWSLPPSKTVFWDCEWIMPQSMSCTYCRAAFHLLLETSVSWQGKWEAIWQTILWYPVESQQLQTYTARLDLSLIDLPVWSFTKCFQEKLVIGIIFMVGLFHPGVAAYENWPMSYNYFPEE